MSSSSGTPPKSSIDVVSVFDIIFPGLGPSSSHTIAPHRAGFLAYENFGRPNGTVEVVVTFSRETATTCYGHKSPEALALGIMGWSPYSAELGRIEPPRLERIPNRKGWMKLTGVKNLIFKFNINSKEEGEGLGIKIAMHDMEKKMTLQVVSTGGGIITEPKIERDPERLFPPIRPTREPGFPTVGQAEKFRFETIEDLKKLAIKNEKSMSEVAIARESEVKLVSEETLVRKMEEYVDIMMNSIEEGIRTQKSGSVYGPEAARVLEYLKKNGSILGAGGRAVAYVDAVMSLAASMGMVVKAPTIGACGILPASLRVTCEELAPGGRIVSKREMAKALFLAGAIGIVVNHRASISGARHGCQAECGVAAAMAAAAVMDLRGTSPQQVADAIATALVGCLGWPCDTFGGLVECPCRERNMAAVEIALGTSDYACAGHHCLATADEVIDALDEIGRDMRSKYKETSAGPFGRSKKSDDLRKALRT